MTIYHLITGETGEHCIDIPFMRRQVVDPKSVKKNVTRLGMDKSTDRPEGCGLSTAGG